AAVVGYLNRGETWPRVVLSTETPGAVNIAAGDLNGDGRPDLVVAMREQKIDPAPGRGLVWLENRADGWRFHEIDTSDRWRDTRTVQIGDIDGDGRPDILATDFRTGHAAWFRNTGTGWAHNPLPVDTRNAHFGRLVDMNHDG